MTTTEKRPAKLSDGQREVGVFAALLAELRSEAEASQFTLERNGEHWQSALESSGRARELASVVQLSLPGLGLRPFVVDTDAPSDAEREGHEGWGERWTTREVGRQEKRPSARRRERIQALRARRELSHRSSAASPFDRSESAGQGASSATQCARPSLRVLLHHDLVVVRRRREPDAASLGECLADANNPAWDIEVHELERGAVGGGEDPSMCALERIAVVKPAGVVAHLQALDRALIDVD